MKENYSYFLEKSSELIHKLIIGKVPAKERLSECEFEIIRTLFIPVPQNLNPLREKILKNLCKKPEIRIDDEVKMNSFQRTLIYMKNATAAKIINDIYTLHIETMWHEDNVNSNK